MMRMINYCKTRRVLYKTAPINAVNLQYNKWKLAIQIWFEFGSVIHKLDAYLCRQSTSMHKSLTSTL